MKNRTFFIVIFIFILGSAIRFAWLLYSCQYATANISYIGLIAKYISCGKYFPIWLYKTASLGTVFPYIASVFVLFSGLNMLNLALPELIFSLLFVLLTYFAGKALYGRVGGIISMTIISLAPFNLINAAAYPNGVYNIFLFISSILFLITIRLYKNEIRNNKYFICIIYGFLSGICLWIHIYSVCFLIPCIFFVVLTRKTRFNIKQFNISLVFLSSFLTGSMPFWWFNLNNNFETFQAIGLRNIGDILVYYPFNIISLQINNMLGGGILSWISVVLGIVYFISFVYFCYSTLKQKTGHINYLILLFFIITVAIITKVKVVPSMDLHPALLLYAVLPYIITYFILQLKKTYKFLAYSTLVFIIALQLANCSLRALAVRENNIKHYTAQEKLIQSLESFDVHCIYTNKNLLPTISFLSDEDIIPSLYYGDCDLYFSNIYSKIVDAAKNIAVVLSDPESSVFKNALDYLCYGYEEKVIGEYVLLHSFIPPVKARSEVFPDKWTAIANYNNKDVKLAFDRNVSTRWTTHQWQTEDMKFLLDLGKEVVFDKIIIYLDGDIADRAIVLKIEVSNDKDNWKELVVASDNRNIMFWSGPRLFWKNYADRQEYYFKPVSSRFIRFSQQGYLYNNYNYWSIRELFVYTPLNNEYSNEYKIADIKNYLDNKDYSKIYTDYWFGACLNRKDVVINGAMDLNGSPLIITDKNIDISYDLNKYDILYKRNEVGGFFIYHLVTDKIDNPDALYWTGFSVISERDSL